MELPVSSKRVATEFGKAILPHGILILGAAKSGTTGLFYAIANSLSAKLGRPIQGLFEPTRIHEFSEYIASGTDPVLLSKVLLGPFYRLPSEKIENSFDKKIVIYRDPRDNVVSRILFMLTNLFSRRDAEKIARVLELFRSKERAPDSISIVEIITEVARLSGRSELLANVRNNAILPAKIRRERGDAFFMMPYDDLVAGDFGALGRYLDFPIASDFAVPDKHAYVIRTKSSGTWKDWFLEQDIQYFACDVADDYRLLGFDPEAKANTIKNIDPKTSSEYVIAQFERVREKRRARKRRLAAVAEANEAGE